VLPSLSTTSVPPTGVSCSRIGCAPLPAWAGVSAGSDRRSGEGADFAGLQASRPGRFVHRQPGQTLLTPIR
jgi:hypothetical protein